MQTALRISRITLQYIPAMGHLPCFSISWMDWTIMKTPNSIMPLRVSKYSTSRESVCAAEYAYLLGYQKVGDSLATRMVGKPPSLAKSLTPTRVKLLGDINSFPYVYAVQTSEGSVDDCEELLEVVDNDVDKIDARIEVEVMLEIESTTVSWSAVEYACHLGYVDIVKHLLLK
ncbi:hypothetical protein L917_14446 [Phytophthora nicotianae]|uniref:Uncharacterized protein n=1 Tax=Phytophthora nicotianae TaxID=4792 RepID=W2KP61_PHYNI|nr:hypothetical protein L917_14446 [Phytophthora nicotianae]